MLSLSVQPCSRHHGTARDDSGDPSATRAWSLEGPGAGHLGPTHPIQQKISAWALPSPGDLAPFSNFVPETPHDKEMVMSSRRKQEMGHCDPWRRQDLYSKQISSTPHKAQASGDTPRRQLLGVSSPHRSSCLHLPSAGITRISHQLGLFSLRFGSPE